MPKVDSAKAIPRPPDQESAQSAPVSTEGSTSAVTPAATPAATSHEAPVTGGTPPPTTMTAGAQPAGVTLPPPASDKSASRIGHALGSAGHHIEKELARVAWRALPKVDIEVDLDLPEVGPLSGRIALAPDIRVHDDRTIRRNPDWRAFNDEQAKKGNDVYWVSMIGSLELDADVVELPTATSGKAQLRSAIEVTMTVPVIVPKDTAKTMAGLGRFFKDAFNQTLRDLPYDVKRAQRVSGPWELIVAGRYGLDGDVRRRGERLDAKAMREVVTRINKNRAGTELVANVTRQLIPTVGADGRIKLYDSDDLDVELTAGPRITFYHIDKDRYRVDLDANESNIESAYGRLFTLREPQASNGVTHEVVDRIETWSDETSGGLRVGIGDSVVDVSASRKALPAHDPFIREDQFRSAAARERDVVYEHLAFNRGRTLGLRGSATLGPVVISAGASHRLARLDEMIVERPRSLLHKVVTSVRDMVNVPQSADDLSERAPGEQFRTLSVERLEAGTSVGHGYAAELGSVGVHADVSTGTRYDREVIRDFKRYVLPDNHVLVDMRLYDMHALATATKARATLELFARDDVEQVLADYLGGTLSGPLAKVVEKYFGEIGVIAEHIRGLNGRSYERLLRSELDLNQPAHREIYALLEAGEIEAAAARLEQLTAAGNDIHFVVESPTNDDKTQYVQVSTGGVTLEVSHTKGPGSTVREAMTSVSADNQLIASYTGERVSAAGSPEKWRLGLAIGSKEFDLFTHDAFREQSTESATYSRGGPDGQTHVVTLQRDAAELRIERKMLWSKDSLAYHVVEFRERETSASGPGEWSEPVVYVVADYDSKEWISGGDLAEFQGFVDAVGGARTHERIGTTNWFENLITFGQRRHGSGEIKVRCWIPLAGMQQLGKATDDQIFTAAAIVAATMDKEPMREMPAWHRASPEARELTRRWVELDATTFPDDEQENDELDDLAREYRRATGHSIRKDLTGWDRKALRAVDDLRRIRDSFRGVGAQHGVSRTEVADAWRDFGEAHGNDYWKLAMVRWMSLLQRDPNAAGARHGDDDLFHIDLLRLDSKADVVVARERRVPDDARRIAAIKKRSASDYRIESL